MAAGYRREEVTDGWDHYLVGYGLLQREGKVLLVGNRWRWDQRIPLVWTLPGGRAEPGEAILGALQREFREETGLTPQVGPLLWVTEVFDPDKRQHFISLVFLVPSAEGDLSFTGDEYVVDARFVEEAALGDYLCFPTYREPLLAYLRSPAEAPGYHVFTLRHTE